MLQRLDGVSQIVLSPSINRCFYKYGQTTSSCYAPYIVRGRKSASITSFTPL